MAQTMHVKCAPHRFPGRSLYCPTATPVGVCFLQPILHILNSLSSANGQLHHSQLHTTTQPKLLFAPHPHPSPSPLCPCQANSQNLSNVLWAYAFMEVPSHTLFATLLPRVKALAQQNKLSTQSISNIAWAYAKAGEYEAELFDELAKCAAPQMQRFNVQVRGHRWGEAGRGGIQAGECSELCWRADEAGQHRGQQSASTSRL